MVVEEEETVGGNDEGRESLLPEETPILRPGRRKGLFYGLSSRSDFVSSEDLTGREGPRAKLASMASGLWVPSLQNLTRGVPVEVAHKALAALGVQVRFSFSSPLHIFWLCHVVV